MRDRRSRFALIALLIVATGMIAVALLPKKTVQMRPNHSLQIAQRADVAEGFRGEAFDPRFIRLSAFERVLVPDCPDLTAPLGTESGAFSYNAQPFWSENEKRGGNHSGDDLNGIGGMNTDLGDSVFSIGNGRVLFAGEASPGWGKIVLIAHRIDGEILQSMFAHLESVHVSTGQTVSRGQRIGTVGTGNGHYLAHLHFELRRASTVDVLRGYLSEKGIFLQPSSVISNYGGVVSERLPSSAFQILKEVKAEKSVEMPIDVLERLR